jgi:hypothetical protein
VTIASKLCTTASNLAIKNLSNGTFAFHVAAVPGFVATPIAGHTAISGAAVKVDVIFS